MQVFAGGRTIPLNRIGDFQGASDLMVRGAQHTHRRKKRPSRCAFPVKAAQEKDWPVSDPFDSGGCRLNAGSSSQAKGDGLLARQTPHQPIAVQDSW
jgi:hypothetical protein